MASREEEKRRRREEREAQELAAARAAQRQKRLRIGGAALLGAGAVGAAVVALALEDGSSDMQTSTTAAGDAPRVAIPAQRSRDLAASVRAAGCVFRELPSSGQGHTTSPVRYKSNPPTSGEHYPEPAPDGMYAPGNSPTAEQSVHALEHGRVLIQWKPGLSARTIGQLRSLFDENDAYHVLMFENQTKMPYEVAISSWTRFLGCPTFSPKVFDAFRNFRAKYTDQAPERIP